ncbi:MAG: YwbE family protein [Desulfococcaceae bacterium]
MNPPNRAQLRPGLEVEIVQKQDQRSGRLTRGVLKDILTKSGSHPHGIKVRLESGEVGRVKGVVGEG